MKKTVIKLISILFWIILFIPPQGLNAQGIGKFEKWLNVGSFHNWYSSIGGEREEDHPAAPTFIQVWGWQWPAFYPRQDMQAAKGLWIGTKNYLDPQVNINFEFKTVHCGPRPQTGGLSEFFPIEFKHYAKFQPTEVRVDNTITRYPGQEVNIDEIDPTLPYDQMIYNYVNTQLGMSMKRKIYQFSNEYYDNFHVIEYTFINTGNLDADEEIERTSGTLEEVYFYFQNRIGFIQETSNLFGAPTQYGKATLNDEFGPYPAGHNDNMRYAYAWFGYWNEFTEYNNIGGPIFHPDNVTSPRINAADTVGRLGIPQFSGTLTLYAQTSTDNNADDMNQPSTTGYYSSDGDLNYSSDVFSASEMQRRYQLMIKGHPQQSHADWITNGDYVNSTANPYTESINSAGYSYVNCYGPYTIPYGDSIKIILVDAANGLNRDECIRIGKLFKSGAISVAQKNTEVLKGRDSLRLTFKRVEDAYNNSWANIPQQPYPPKTFNIYSRGGRIDLEWTPNDEGPAVTGYEIYRNTLESVDGYASNEYYSKYEKIAELGPTEISYSDTSQRQDIAYYYYIVSLGDLVPANSQLNIPAHRLASNRAYTQSYIGAFRRRPGEPNVTDKVRAYPNPYIISASDNWMFGSGSVERNKIAFDHISGECKILIFTEMGELIRTIEHTDGSGSQDWDLRTSSNQLVVSGIYIAVVIDNNTGDKQIVKFSIIR